MARVSGVIIGLVKFLASQHVDWILAIGFLFTFFLFILVLKVIHLDLVFVIRCLCYLPEEVRPVTDVLEAHLLVDNDLFFLA